STNDSSRLARTARAYLTADGRNRAYAATVRAFRLIVGGGLEPELRSVAAVTALASIAFSGFWTFVGVFGLKGLGARSGELGIALGVEACAAALSGYVGGALSDRIGRKPLIVFGWSGQAVAVVALALVGR